MKRDMVMEKAHGSNGNGHGHAKAHEEGTAPVGDTPEVVDLATKAASPDKATSSDKPGEVVVTKQRKRLSAKPRDGFEDQVEPMVQLYESNGPELGTSISPAETRAQQKEVARLEKLEEEQKTALQKTSGQLTLLRGDMWSTTLEIYGKANGSRKLKNDPTVVAFRNFMKNGPRKKDEGEGGGTPSGAGGEKK